MKTRIIHSLLFVLLLIVSVACQNAYPGIYFDYDENGKDKNNEEIVQNEIRVSLNDRDIFYVSATRGVGIFDPTDGDVFKEKYLNSKFYVLSYRRTVYSSGDLSSKPNLTLLMNSAGNEGKKDCLVSTEQSGGGTSHRGKMGIPSSMSGYLDFYDETKTDEKVKLYYSDTYPNVGYDFYAYYIDDAKINSISANEDKTVYHLTIDGTQDIIAGSAPTLTKELLKEEIPSITDPKIVNNILYYGDGGYSAYSAGYGIQPCIDIKHQLAVLNFFITLKDEKAKIKVKKISIKTMTEGDLVVASRNKDEIGYTPTGGEKEMSLDTPEETLEYNKCTNLGTQILVPEAEEYTVTLTYEQSELPKTPDGEVYEPLTRTAELKISMPNDTFKPGYKYRVDFNMYGATEIITNVKLFSWEEGGNINIEN